MAGGCRHISSMLSQALAGGSRGSGKAGGRQGGLVLAWDLFRNYAFFCQLNFLPASPFSPAWMLVVGRRKGQCKIPSNGKWRVGFDKHSASTYVFNEIFKGTISISVIYSHEAGFPRMLPSIRVLPILQHAQKLSLLDFRYIVDQLYQTTDDAGVVRLLCRSCHIKTPLRDHYALIGNVFDSMK